MKKTALVAGDGVAAILSALLLARRGTAVTWHASNRPGGHFAGIDACGRRFDPGMTFLELDSFAADSNAGVLTYDATRRNDVGRFTPLVGKTLHELGIQTRKVPLPRMRVAGQTLPDAIVANRLEGLRELPQAGRAREELRAIVAGGRGPLHAANKLRLEREPWSVLSRANHGDSLHRSLFEPFARKLAGADPLGPYHRLAWLPLYYPETLLRALEGEPSGLPETSFDLPVLGSLSAAVDLLATLARAEPGVKLAAGLPGAEALRSAPFAIWTAPPDALLKAAGEPAEAPERVRLDLAFVLVPVAALRTRASALFVVDGEHLPYRICDQDFAAGTGVELARLCLEWGTEGAHDAGAALEELGICEAGKVAQAEHRSAPLTPATAFNLRLAREKDARLDRLFPGVLRIGAAAPFGAASFNDQAVQALRAVAEASS